MLLSSTDTKRTLMHLFLFTKSAQREMVSIRAQSMRPQLTFLALVPGASLSIYLITAACNIQSKDRARKNGRLYIIRQLSTFHLIRTSLI